MKYNKEENTMKKYKAYTQADWNAEKFYIDDENEMDVIFEAENANAAKEAAINWLYNNSLFSAEETAEWISKNPICIEEI